MSPYLSSCSDGLVTALTGPSGYVCNKQVNADGCPKLRDLLTPTPMRKASSGLSASRSTLSSMKGRL